MKRTIISIALLYCGVIVCLTILGYGFKYSKDLTVWRESYGKLWTLISDNHLLLPFYFSLAVSLVAFVLLLIEYFFEKK